MPAGVTGVGVVGVYGGTFDPPHLGHYLTCLDAVERLGLDTLIIVPAASQPLKAGSPPTATAEQRLRMLELTFLPSSATRHPFQISRSELDRGGLSYTVDTLEEFSRERLGQELVLLLGADSWCQFNRWHRHERILELARVVILRRDDSAGHGVNELPTRRIDISSTEIRERVRAGNSIRGFVVPEVERLIESEGLYKSL